MDDVSLPFKKIAAALLVLSLFRTVVTCHQIVIIICNSNSTTDNRNSLDNKMIEMLRSSVETQPCVCFYLHAHIVL